MSTFCVAESPRSTTTNRPSSDSAGRLADTAFDNFLDLIGRPNQRLVLPSRGMPVI
jgi:hypothetical protein